MKMLQFESTKGIYIDFDGDVHMVSFNDADHYLMLQKSEEYDEQDEELGMDTFHIERDDQSYGGYGGVAKVILEKTKIKILLDATGQKHLKCEQIEVSFQADDETFEELVSELEFIFEDLIELNF